MILSIAGVARWRRKAQARSGSGQPAGIVSAQKTIKETERPFGRSPAGTSGNAAAVSPYTTGTITLTPVPSMCTLNAFADQFSRYFPDLRARHIAAGHFFPEEAPDETNQTLVAFLKGAL